LHPFVPNVHSDFGTLVLGTDRFAVEIVGGCSGLEGVGLMLVFCVSWLWFFRREYYFPRALIIVPVAMILIFLLNTVRIAALVLIGDAGFPRIAVLGFHSQAGWIAFNAAAFAVAIVAKHSAWLNRTVTQARVAAPAHNPTAPYLVPLLTILALGMFAHAMSAGFDFLYPLRLIGAAAVLWAYRTHYKSLAWGFSWRAVTVGIALFVVWVAFDRWLGAPRAMPDALEYVSAPARALWVACRALAAIVTVPIAEELAYRGFLMRRLAAAEFESLSFSKVGWPALIIASIIFGITHGSMWLPGILAGLAFGLLAIRTNKIGEAVGRACNRQCMHRRLCSILRSVADVVKTHTMNTHDAAQDDRADSLWESMRQASAGIRGTFHGPIRFRCARRSRRRLDARWPARSAARTFGPDRDARAAGHGARIARTRRRRVAGRAVHTGPHGSAARAGGRNR
jgi:exosortase E/protease (VPEID-CTERM system)